MTSLFILSFKLQNASFGCPNCQFGQNGPMQELANFSPPLGYFDPEKIH
jgi:hypothetical protein